MSSLSKGKRNSRKAKTFVLYEVKNPVEQNVEVGQSINIVSLKNPYANQKQLERIKEQPNIICSKKSRASEIISKNARRAHQSGQLVINLKDEISEGDQHLEKKQSRSSHSYSPKVQDANQVIEKLMRNRLIFIEKDRVFADLKVFKSIISDYLASIDLLESENFKLLGKNRKYEIYLKEMNIKKFNETEESAEKNSQLKILNLERKVETLNYIIKQYRVNNKEEIKNFEKKVNDYRPNLEAELTEMLSQANEKNRELQNLLKYFQDQCSKYCKNIDWVSFVRSIQEKDEQIQQLEEKVQKLEEQLRTINSTYEEDKKIIGELNSINTENLELKWKVSELEARNMQLKADSLEKEQKYYEVSRQYEQLSFKVKALQNLETKIVHKEEAIRRNTQVINRLQNDNYCLKAKIQTLKNNEEKQIFSQDQLLQEKLEKKNNNLEEWSKRFFEEIDTLPEEFRESTSFMSHLFCKVRDSFELIINSYRQQLLTKVIELKDEKSTVDNLVVQNKRRYETCLQIIEDLQQIDMKRTRCVQSQERLTQTDSCSSCMNWMLHWGQINNLYGQIRTLIDKLTKLM